MVKHWRNYHELDGLRSFVIELLLAHQQDTQGPAPSLEDGLTRFFKWVAQTELRAPVTFPECGKPTVWPQSRVVVLDPVNVRNNVAMRMTAIECDPVIDAARRDWETIHTARNNNYKGETLEFWKEVFGRVFTIEE
jgi:hypothetical protein